MDTRELKPCPFCGKSDALMVEHLAGTILHPAYRVRCDWCGAATEYSSSINHISAWNIRASADALSSQASEIERLRGLLWYAWHEFNAIRARSGAPLDHYGMTTCTHEWWDRMTEEFRAAIGSDAASPWPSDEAKAAISPKPNKEGE